MKTLMLILAISPLWTVTEKTSSNSDESAIKEVITAFAKAADEQDATEISSYLDDNYRVVMNQLFGSPKVVVLTKDVYVEKIRAKEFGGDKRTLAFHNISVNGNTACAKVVLKGEKLTLSSIFTLVKNKSGEWKLVGDMPIIV